MKKFGLGVYLLLLGILGGSLITLGMMVAPIVFKAPSIFPEFNLTLFESGKLMSQIIVRFNFFLGAIGFVVLLYEIISFIYDKRSLVYLILGVAIGALCLLFVFYYTPYILNAQKVGEAALQSAEFARSHAQSEWLFKELFVLVCALFFWRLLGKNAV
ncbi:hypothetical protein BB399_01105 [Helicobacter pylori]|uniref:DUF4149 domain-containing protein n=1 Tax=Helicobacter pylori TaxID=210 RepID=UPI000993A734|nr:DUF4149 domain-containing protein [Helicobacter pylori]OOQ05119.1 hypothetical protein B0X51_06340 [Helicobacter pylori]PDW32800.1 hypothetical protein BB452_04560 [Helicobacter pylori]PDX00739.1 hypothetical protein BB399_01105 [Helicobacter pylori]WQU59682.1 DUF4149 domain-containing protein [Helicobacter pylori]